MNNHYVSQFIIKRFSHAINIFDIHTGKINERKKPNKVFYKVDKYDEELERLMNFNIESRVSNILTNKIFVDGDVELTRKELETLKRYMLISSVRTMNEDGLCKILLNFERNANLYIEIHSEYSILPSTKSLNLSVQDLYLRTLKVFATTVAMRDIASNPLATREMLAWAMPFLESYVAFWDAPEDKEFILTDCGMCSEYEGFHLITGGIDISKKSYLLKQIKNGKIEYSGVLASTSVMYENYNICNLSSTRSMVMINPFFRLYHNQQAMLNGSTDPAISLEKPDIWPATIQNRALFAVPRNKYMLSPLKYSPEDLFIYKPKVLSNEDIVYINALMLSQTNNIIGFNDATKIIDSIYYYVWYVGNIKSVNKIHEPPEKVLQRLAENVVKSPYRILCKHCEEKGGVNKTEFLLLFEKLIGYIYKDFDENPYISEYFLDRPDEAAKCKALDFLGIGVNKLDVFKSILKRIEEEKQNADQTI